jgi:precorrin-4/cobalt-precorrin-4 C11-methyltransferase
MTLEEVFSVINEYKSSEIVRLHTGDTSLYSAVKEQIDLLDAAGIPWDITPGVSSFSGAAAALGAEYTLPGISQTVIITRMAGRTPVPEREGIAALAAHGATMVIFLSAGMLEKLQGELLKGAYTEETPAAIVYKATWPEEKVLRCPLGKLAETGKNAGIRKTALIVVGDFLGDTYERSKLYDPTFSTEFREASR